MKPSVFNNGVTDMHEGAVLGYQSGRESGLRDGYARGYDEGRTSGWNDAINEANQKLIQCAHYIQEHVADKKALAAQIDQQHTLILEMKKVIAEYKAECVALREQLRRRG